MGCQSALSAEHGKFVPVGKCPSIEAVGMSPRVTSGSRGVVMPGLIRHPGCHTIDDIAVVAK